MVLILRRGRWSHEAGQWFMYDRLYWRGKWTPIIKVSLRYASWGGR